MRQGGRVESSLNSGLLAPQLQGKLEELGGQEPSWLHGGHFLLLCCSFSWHCEPGTVAPTVPCSMLGLGEPAVNLSPPPEESASPDFAQRVRELALPGRDHRLLGLLVKLKAVLTEFVLGSIREQKERVAR